MNECGIQNDRIIVVEFLRKISEQINSVVCQRRGKNIVSDSDKRFEIAIELEQEGLIQDVVYQLPLTIRAQISQKGIDLLNSLDGG